MTGATDAGSASDPTCLFCRISAGEMPATFLHEDELVIAFRDIAPRAPTHVLLVPRRYRMRTRPPSDACSRSRPRSHATRVWRKQGIGW